MNVELAKVNVLPALCSSGRLQSPPLPSGILRNPRAERNCARSLGDVDAIRAATIGRAFKGELQHRKKQSIALG